LAKYLDKHINIYSISFPQNASVDSKIDDLAKIYAKEITQIQSTGEVYLGGYSFGGNVALEIASQLKKEKRNVQKIFMIDSIVPDAYSKDGLDKDKYAQSFPFVWNLMMGNIKEAQSLMNSDTNKDLDELINDMKKEGNISKKFSNTDIKRMFNIWLSNHKALSSQSRDIKVDSQIVIFFAKEKLPEFM
jgi:thioesterase domain-containing protein